MHSGQTRFPYVLITNDPEVVTRAQGLAVNGVDEGRGIVTFQADLELTTVMDALSADGKEVGLVQAYDFQYKNARGDLALILGHLN